MLTSCKVCVELQRASLMHSVASAPGSNAVTSPVETGLFGFSQLHQRSQSIFILHGYPLSQQRLIKRLKEAPNLSKFVVKGSTQAGLREEKIADTKNVEKCHQKYGEIFWGLPQRPDGCNGFTWQIFKVLVAMRSNSYQSYGDWIWKKNCFIEQEKR